MPQTPSHQPKRAINGGEAGDPLPGLALKARQLLLAFAAECGSDPARFAKRVQAEEAFLAEARAAAAPAPSDGTPYSRKIVYGGSEGESMIAHWPAGSVCWPHDHGEAWGAVLVLEGKVFERGFALAGELRESGPEREYGAGEAVLVRPGGIHNMRAEPRSITLHLYAPPIREMKVYDQRSRLIYTVADDCGAWIPREPNLIIRRETFDRDSLHDEVPRGR
jgi:cysteine dioxygenase